MKQISAVPWRSRELGEVEDMARRLGGSTSKRGVQVNIVEVWDARAYPVFVL
jgi:hypothetical protein